MREAVLLWFGDICMRIGLFGGDLVDRIWEESE